MKNYCITLFCLMIFLRKIKVIKLFVLGGNFEVKFVIFEFLNWIEKNWNKLSSWKWCLNHVKFNPYSLTKYKNIDKLEFLAYNLTFTKLVKLSEMWELIVFYIRFKLGVSIEHF